MNKKPKKPIDKHESIWDEDKRLREEAKKLAELHKDKKASKFDLK
jgi:hypothetical protein